MTLKEPLALSSSGPGSSRIPSAPCADSASASNGSTSRVLSLRSCTGGSCSRSLGEPHAKRSLGIADHPRLAGAVHRAELVHAARVKSAVLGGTCATGIVAATHTDARAVLGLALERRAVAGEVRLARAPQISNRRIAGGSWATRSCGRRDRGLNATRLHVNRGGRILGGGLSTAHKGQGEQGSDELHGAARIRVSILFFLGGAGEVAGRI